MQKTGRLSDEEIERLGYEALAEKLGPVGAARYIGLWLERAGDDYTQMDKPINHMTIEEIHAEAARFESESRGN